MIVGMITNPLFTVYRILVILISIFFIMFSINVINKMDSNKDNIYKFIVDIKNSKVGPFLDLLVKNDVIDKTIIDNAEKMFKEYFKYLRDILIALAVLSGLSIFLALFVFSSLTYITFPAQVIIFIMYVDSIIKLFNSE